MLPQHAWVFLLTSITDSLIDISDYLYREKQNNDLFELKKSDIEQVAELFMNNQP